MHTLSLSTVIRKLTNVYLTRGYYTRGYKTQKLKPVNIFKMNHQLEMKAITKQAYH